MSATNSPRGRAITATHITRDSIPTGPSVMQSLTFPARDVPLWWPSGPYLVVTVPGEYEPPAPSVTVLRDALAVAPEGWALIATWADFDNATINLLFLPEDQDLDDHLISGPVPADAGVAQLWSAS